jgi:hypothetical protein
VYKVNWDAAVDKKNGRIEIEIVVCNYEGVVLAARSTTKNVMVELFVAEALVAFYAMELCRKIGYIDIILEGDALQIVNAAKATSNN